VNIRRESTSYADMFRGIHWSTNLTVSLLLLVVLSTPASAYLDGGTGSLFVQVVLAGVLAGLVMAKSVWFSIKDGIGRIFARRTGSTHSDR
jgi:hypothetical protein